MRAAPWLLLVGLFLGGDRGPGPACDTPWASGDEPIAGWRVDAYERLPGAPHSFLRVRLQSTAGRDPLTLEIGAAPVGAPPGRCDARTCVQPAPGQSVEEALLVQAQSALSRWRAQRPGCPALVARHVPGAAAGLLELSLGLLALLLLSLGLQLERGRRLTLSAALWAALIAAVSWLEGPASFLIPTLGAVPFELARPALLGAYLVLPLLLGILHAWPDPVRIRRTLGLGLLGVGLTVAWFGLVSPGDLPRWIFSHMREGGTLQHVANLFGQEHFSGPPFEALLSLLRGDQPRVLVTLIHWNIWLALINGALVGAVAFALLRSRLAALGVAALFLFNWSAVHATLHGGPRIFLDALMLHALVAFALLSPRRDGGLRHWSARAAALGVIAMTLGLAWRTRAEFSAYLLTVLAVAIPRAVFGDARLVNAGRTLWQAVSRRLGTRRRRWVALGLAAAGGALGLAAFHGVAAAAGGDVWSDALRALDPLNPLALDLPGDLWRYLPAGVVLLTLIGLARSLTHPIATALIFFPFLSVFKAYEQVASPVFGEYRMHAHLTSLAVLIALYGAAGIREPLRRWLAARRPALRVALVLGMTSLALVHGPWLVPLEAPRAAPTTGATPAEEVQLFFDHDQQHEIRFLLDALDQRPECGFVTRATLLRPRPGLEALTPIYFTFDGQGYDLSATARAARGADEARRLARDHLAGHPCVYFYRSLDCALGPDGCGAEIAGLVPEDVRRSPAREFFDDTSALRGGPPPARFTIGLYRIR